MDITGVNESRIRDSAAGRARKAATVITAFDALPSIPAAFINGAAEMAHRIIRTKSTHMRMYLLAKLFV